MKTVKTSHREAGYAGSEDMVAKEILKSICDSNKAYLVNHHKKTIRKGYLSLRPSFNNLSIRKQSSISEGQSFFQIDSIVLVFCLLSLR